MESKILAAIGIDPAFIFIFLLVLIVILFFMVVNVNMKYKRLKSSYSSFMRGRDGKNLEQSILEKFDELDEITEIAKKLLLFGDFPVKISFCTVENSAE